MNVYAGNDDVFLNGTSLSGSSKRIVASNSKTSTKWTSSVVPDPRVVVEANCKFIATL